VVRELCFRERGLGGEVSGAKGCTFGGEVSGAKSRGQEVSLSGERVSVSGERVALSGARSRG
jgi:hypothetical protein